MRSRQSKGQTTNSNRELVGANGQLLRRVSTAEDRRRRTASSLGDIRRVEASDCRESDAAKAARPLQTMRVMNAIHKLAVWIPYALVVSCGGSPAHSGSFIGSWMASGQQTTQCSTGTVITPGAGPLVIEGGPTQIVTKPGNGCNLVWNVAGETAMLARAQTCTLPNVIGTFTSGTMVLEGRTISIADQGYGTVDGSIPCTFGQAVTLTRN
jgi:hypothetical protein